MPKEAAKGLSSSVRVWQQRSFLSHHSRSSTTSRLPITIQTKEAPGKGTKKSTNAPNDEKEKEIKRRDTLRYNFD